MQPIDRRTFLEAAGATLGASAATLAAAREAVARGPKMRWKKAFMLGGRLEGARPASTSSCSRRPASRGSSCSAPTSSTATRSSRPATRPAW